MTAGIDETAYLELIADRFEFLLALDGDHFDKRELTERLPYSRSTVNRAIRDLSAAGLVLSTPEGYTVSLKGQYLSALFDTYRRDVRNVLEVDAAISAKVGDYPLPSVALLDADVAVASEGRPHRPLQHLTDTFGRADYGTFVMPQLPKNSFAKRLTTWLSTDHACRLVAPESVVTALWREYPELLDGIQTAPDCTLRVGAVPPYGLAYTVVDGEPSSTVIMYEDRRVQSVITNTSNEAVAWAQSYTQSLWEDANPFDLTGHLDWIPRETARDETEPDSEAGLTNGDEWATTSAARTQPTTHTGRPLPTTLQSQGFVRLAPDYFDRVGVSPPLACWRAGFDLAEVNTGYALDRERPTDDGRENVTSELFERLCQATDHVVVGPPGAGKSTVCMSVACRWYDRQRGPVIYRKSGHRDAFAATARLASYLTSAPGHTLVVIEDATRAEANAVFELVRDFADDDRVTFLLDSRENEWQTDNLVGAAQLESHRTHAIREYTVPPVDARERERLIEHFESTVNERVDIAAEQISVGTPDRHSGDDSGDFRTGNEATTPGEMYLFVHRLARHVEPTPTSRAPPTSLLDDIDSVYEELRDVGDLAIDVGVLVNLLNAAGVHVDIPLAYALATDRSDESVIETALDKLERSVLYSALESEGDEPVRTVHETWSAQFLHRLCGLESERHARRRFERCLTALCSLVDDEQARMAVQSIFGGTADVIRTIEADPSAWGSNLVKNVFELGVNNPALSSLFAESDYTNVDVPQACDSSLSLDTRRWRARMFVNAGDLDRAMREFESLSTVDRASVNSRAIPSDALVGARADGLAGVSEVLQKRGAYDEARGSAESALALFEQLDDDLGRSDVLNSLGAIESRCGNFEQSRQYYESALQLRRDAGDATRIASTLSNLAGAERSLGEYDAALDHARESLEIRREIGYPWGEAVSLEILGIIEMETERLDKAEQYICSSLSIRREIGDTLGTKASLNNLGRIEFEQGRIEDAYARYTALVDQVKDEDVGWVRGNAHYGLAEVSLERGDADAAFEHAERARKIVEDEFKQAELQSLQALAKLDSGDLDAATELATDVFETAQSLDGEQQVYAGIAFGRTLATDGSASRALEVLTQTVEAAPNNLLKGRALVNLGEVYQSLGELQDALDAFDDAAACFSAVESRGRVRKTVTQALEVANQIDDDDLHMSLGEYIDG
ncbi:tetratricopeptide repeat protein [Haloferax sp. DFSO60]|uniref:tetratricopeptide repeat protein n=1 Tax=Haloferax sp. DFSO60 TaxID=3388652 RepID=UPI00397CC550